uniref:Uncharacterized protein n=1 Tax=Maylandia zebra TaxID=106582 RepID=A0A3P9BXA5_9CICH
MKPLRRTRSPLKPIKRVIPEEMGHTLVTSTIDVYQIISRPVGLCVIINNKNFKDGTQRRGTDKDARKFQGQIFYSFLLALTFVASLQVLEHGDAFICSILSHGKRGVALGTDRNPLPIKEITRKTSPLTIPEEADVLVAMATVEDHASFRHIVDGSWFVQSLCEQLKEGEDIVSILHYVNDDVQMPEVRVTLRKKLVLPPQCT